MKLDDNDFRMLHAFVDKEIMPFEGRYINKYYNITHIRYIAEGILGFSIKSGIIAHILRERGVAYMEKNGRTHFAISNEFFIDNRGYLR